MKILLTNDDGIYADGLYAAYSSLKKIGSVAVIAPDSERSSVGHGITLAHPIWYKKVKRKGTHFGYAISGTPADCVKFATGVILREKPDVVVSGINCGANDGSSVFYSGTVAAAREGALSGIPSMAISLATFVNPDFRYAAKVAVQLVRKIRKNALPSGVLLNVNVPAVAPTRIKGMKITHQCMMPFQEVFTKRTHPRLGAYYWMTGKVPKTTKKLQYDTYALAKNYVTITPVQCNLTAEAVIPALEQWRL